MELPPAMENLPVRHLATSQAEGGEDMRLGSTKTVLPVISIGKMG